MSQTSIPRSGQSRALAGLIADNAAVDLVSAFSAEASAEIAFGLGVVNLATGNGERAALLPANSTDIFLGVVAWSPSHQPSTSTFDLGTTGIKPKGGMELCRKGRLWVVVDKAVTTIIPYKDRGFLRYTADGSTNPTVGAWSNVTDSGKNIDLTKVVQFLSAVVTAADGVTKIALAEIMAVNKQ